MKFLSGSEKMGFCGLIKSFLSSIAIATLRKKDEIRVQNAFLQPRMKTSNEFEKPLYKSHSNLTVLLKTFFATFTIRGIKLPILLNKKSCLMRFQKKPSL